MGITANRAYNDPNLGAAFGSLAQAFMPPSGSDLSGYATAAATRDQASRLAWLFANSQDPTASERSALTGIQNYGATPEGFGMTDATNRYGIDTTASTSRANNADDNTRALATNAADNAAAALRNMFTTTTQDATNRRGQDIIADTSTSNNAADNARALATNTADNAGMMARQLALPVHINQNETVVLPKQTAAATGLDPTLSGVTNVGKDQISQMPDGSTIAGPVSPLSETEMIATILGKQSSADQRAAALSNVPVETVIKNGKPVVVNRVDAVGQQPASSNAPVQILGPGGLPIYGDALAAAAAGDQVYQKPKDASYENYVVKNPDGTTRTVLAQAMQNGRVMTPTGEDVSDSVVQKFGTTVQGSAGETGVRTTEYIFKVNSNGEVMLPGVAELANLYRDGVSVSGASLAYKALTGDGLAATDFGQRYGLISEQDQNVYGSISAVMNFLYTQTGAARSEKEDQRGYIDLVPLSSDTPETRQRKRDNLSARALAIISQSNDPSLRARLEDGMKGLYRSPVLNANPGNAGQPGTDQTTTQYPTPSQAAIDYLKADPSLKGAFELKYGPGSAAAAGVN